MKLRNTSLLPCPLTTFVRLTAAIFVLAVPLSHAQAEEVSLFNGKDLTGWQEPLGKWSVVGAVTLSPTSPKLFITTPGEGIILNAGRSAPLVSKAEHGDADIHVEFCVPKCSNSGIYVMDPSYFRGITAPSPFAICGS